MAVQVPKIHYLGNWCLLLLWSTLCICMRQCCLCCIEILQFHHWGPLAPHSWILQGKGTFYQRFCPWFVAVCFLVFSVQHRSNLPVSWQVGNFALNSPLVLQINSSSPTNEYPGSQSKLIWAPHKTPPDGGVLCPLVISPGSSQLTAKGGKGKRRTYISACCQFGKCLKTKAGNTVTCANWCISPQPICLTTDASTTRVTVVAIVDNSWWKRSACLHCLSIGNTWGISTTRNWKRKRSLCVMFDVLKQNQLSVTEKEVIWTLSAHETFSPAGWRSHIVLTIVSA